MACCMSAKGTFDVTSIRNSDIAQELKVTNKEFDALNQKMKTIEDKLCLWAAPEYGDQGETWEKNFWRAAIIAVATINTVAQMQIMQKRYQIAKDYANLAKEKWERFRDNYAPLEQAMLNEAGNTIEYTPNYPRAKTDGQNNTRNAYQLGNENLVFFAKKYGLCLDETLIDDMNIAESISSSDGVNFNYRDEEWYALIKSDLRWNRRSALLNLGRNIHAQSSSYASAANSILAGLGNLLNEGAQGAMQLLGYISDIRNTQYPAQFSAAAPLTGASSSLGSFLAYGPSSLE